MSNCKRSSFSSNFDFLVFFIKYLPFFALSLSVLLACVYVWSHIYSSKSMDQPGKVANPAYGQLNRENDYLSVRVRLRIGLARRVVALCRSPWTN